MGNNATGKKDYFYLRNKGTPRLSGHMEAHACTGNRLVCILGQFLQPCIDLFPDDYRKIPHFYSTPPILKNERKMTINYSKCLHYTVSPIACMLNSSKLIRMC